MSDDESYDRIKRGQKVRVLDSRLNIESREMADGMTIEEFRTRITALKKRIERVENAPVYSGQNLPKPKGPRIRISPDGTIDGGDAY